MCDGAVSPYPNPEVDSKSYVSIIASWFKSQLLL